MPPLREVIAVLTVGFALLGLTGCSASAVPSAAASSSAVAVVSSAERITTLAEAAAYADALTASAPDVLAEISRTADVLSQLVGENLAAPIALPMKARLVVIQSNASGPGADAATLLTELRDIAHRAAAGAD